MKFLAEGGRARHDVRVVLGERHHERGQVLGHAAGILRALREQHLLHPGELRGGLRGGVRALPRDEDMDVAAHLRGRGDGVGRAAADVGVVVLGNDKGCHRIGSPPARG